MDKANALLVEAQNLLAAEEEKKRQRTEIREREHAVYVREKAEYDQAVAFLRDFIQMVADKFGGSPAAPAFIQFSENLLRHTSKIGKVEAAVPVLIMMTQYVSGTAGDYQTWNGSDAANTLVEKLNSLLATIEADLEVIVQVENQRQEDYNAFLVAVNQNIADLNASIATLQEQIRSNEECVARENGIITEATNKIARNADLKEKAITMCAKFVEEVKEAQNARRIEIGVVSQILALMRIRFGKVPESMTNYLASVEASFAEYENKTKLIAYQVYKYMALNENALGKDIADNREEYVENRRF